MLATDLVLLLIWLQYAKTAIINEVILLIIIILIDVNKELGHVLHDPHEQVICVLVQLIHLLLKLLLRGLYLNLGPIVHKLLIHPFVFDVCVRVVCHFVLYL